MNYALRFFPLVQNFLNGEEGQDLVEYALLVSLIALAAVTAVSGIASGITTIFKNVSTSIV